MGPGQPMTSALETLSGRLLPWLEPALAQLDTARRAGSLGHAWLISGPAGVGKVNLALVLARRLLGNDAEPAILDSEAALAAMAVRHEPVDRHPDLHWLYPEEDKETISIEQVRDVTSTFTLTAHRGGAKVIVIEPAEALTTAAANALLKTLEEPTPQGYLLLLSHQPGRLPATIRSRCQHVAVAAPDVDASARWLGVSPSAVLEAQRSAGAAPLLLAAAIREETANIFNRLESDLTELSQDRLEPHTVAQAWAKGDTELTLSWLKRRFHEELKARLAQRSGSTDVTVPGASALHNAWRALPTRTLFDEYDRAEKLLNQLGSGLNIELALVAMLNALVVNRGLR
jgi:DNA polymerase III subunit delta'